MKASVVPTVLIHESYLSLVGGGCHATTPQGGTPAFFEVFSMAKKPVYKNPDLPDSEIKKINGMIGRSWKNGRRSGAKNAYRYLFSKNRIKGGSS